MDFRSEFRDETLFLTLDILAACCIMNGKGASSSNWSSSAQKTQMLDFIKKLWHPRVIGEALAEALTLSENKLNSKLTKADPY